MPPFLLLYWKQIGLALLIAALMGGSFFKGYSIGHKQYVEFKTEVEAKQKATSVATTIISSQAQVAHEEKQQEIKTVYKTIRERVPVYVEKIKYDCAIPAYFTRLWDDTSAMRIPSPPTIADESTLTTLKLEDVIAVHTDDAQQYSETAQQLIDLQNWIRSIQKVK